MAPLYFKQAVDALSSQTHLAAKAAVVALLWSGACRIVNGLAKEIQHPVFTPVAQARYVQPSGKGLHLTDIWQKNCFLSTLVALVSRGVSLLQCSFACCLLELCA